MWFSCVWVIRNTSPASTGISPVSQERRRRPAASRPAKRPSRVRFAVTTRNGLPGAMASRDQAARTASKPSPACQRSSQCTMPAESDSSTSSGPQGDPISVRSVARYAKLSGWERQLTPKPITQAKRPSGSVAPSSSMPDSLAPSCSRSFGHLSTRRGSPPSKPRTACASATPATKPSCGARAGGAGSIRRSDV